MNTKNEKLLQRIERLENQIKELQENYINNRECQTRLSQLSEQLSDAYAQLNDLPSINDVERRQWQKANKVGMKQVFGIDTTVQILTTKHGLAPLEEEQLKQVLNRINELYNEMENLLKQGFKRNSKEYKTAHKEYLNLKSKLEEVLIKPKPIELPKEQPINIEYTVENVSAALKNLYFFKDRFEYTDIYLDLVQAISVAQFTPNQLLAIEEAVYYGQAERIRKNDYKYAVEKVVHLLNTSNVYKLPIINRFNL